MDGTAVKNAVQGTALVVIGVILGTAVARYAEIADKHSDDRGHNVGAVIPEDAEVETAERVA